MHAPIDRRAVTDPAWEAPDVIPAQRRVLPSPRERAPQGQGVLGHLLTDHRRSALELMPCSDRLVELHRFEHVEAELGLVLVDHVHRSADAHEVRLEGARGDPPRAAHNGIAVLSGKRGD
jgi:hypothetical protein